MPQCDNAGNFFWCTYDAKIARTHADSYQICMITFNGTQHSIINTAKLITSNGNGQVMMPIMHPMDWEEDWVCVCACVWGVGGTRSHIFCCFIEK